MTCYNILLLFRMCAVKLTFAAVVSVIKKTIDFKSAFFL